MHLCSLQTLLSHDGGGDGINPLSPLALSLSAAHSAAFLITLTCVGDSDYGDWRIYDNKRPAQQRHTLETHFTVRDFLVMGNQNAGGFGWDLSNTTAAKQVEFVMLGFHCHSPACLGGDLFNADTGQLICHVEPQAGNSTMYGIHAICTRVRACVCGGVGSGKLSALKGIVSCLRPEACVASLVEWLPNSLCSDALFQHLPPARVLVWVALHTPRCLLTAARLQYIYIYMTHTERAHYEENYLWLPPCQFGNPADGYE